MNRIFFVIFAATLCLNLGCTNEPAAPANGAAAAVVPQQEQEKGESGIGDKIGNLVEQAKSKAPSMDDVKKMFNDAGDATGQTADDTMKWANEMYKSLSERGMTTTTNVKDWISEDWNNINAWEYQVVSVQTEDPAALQKKLNESGSQRWDCFHVSSSGAKTTFFMKRQKKSYMKSLPLKDMLKLIPLLDNEN